MRRSEFRWTPGGLVQIPVDVCPSPKSIDDGRATTTRGSDETYLAGAQSEENNCNGLGACRHVRQAPVCGLQSPIP